MAKMDIEEVVLKGKNTLSLFSNLLIGRLLRLSKLTVLGAEF